MDKPRKFSTIYSALVKGKKEVNCAAAARSQISVIGT
jgi:hypothetical protein